MTTVSIPHPANQSASWCRSVVKVPKRRTGSASRSELTAAMCIVAPMSIAAAFGCITLSSERVPRPVLLRFIQPSWFRVVGGGGGGGVSQSSPPPPLPPLPAPPPVRCGPPRRRGGPPRAARGPPRFFFGPPPPPPPTTLN